MSVRVAHEHAGEVGADHADVGVVEGADVAGAADGEHVVRGGREGRDKPGGDGGSDDNPASKEDTASWAGSSQPVRAAHSASLHNLAVRALQGTGEPELGGGDVGDVHRRRRSASRGVRDDAAKCKRRGVRPAYVVSKTIVATEEDDRLGLGRAEDVTALFERGVISHEAFDKKDPGRMEGGNYVEYGVSMRTLRGFLMGIRRELLEHKLCDLAFTRYLREGCGLPMCRLQPKGIPWLYFYRRDPGIGQVCVSLRNEVCSRGLQNNVELMCAVLGGSSIRKYETLRKQAGGTGSMPAVLYKRAWRHAQGAKALMQVPNLVM